MPYRESVDERLLEFCESDTERRSVQGVLDHGSIRKAATALRLNFNSIRVPFRRVAARAALAGWAPEADMTHQASAAHIVKGTSTYYDREGQVRGQWVKTDLDRERMEQIRREAAEAFAEELPREKPVKLGKAKRDEDLCNLYVITDYHFGSLAWGEETRQGDWDLSIAEETLYRWFERAISLSPPAKVAVLCMLGDDLDIDGPVPATPTSGHILDVDSRFAKIVRMWIRLRRRIHRLLLEKYEHLHIKQVSANHDPASQIWMREWLAATYEDEPRVSVDTSPGDYYAYEWGQTSLFFHHGHRARFDKVWQAWAGLFREMLGRTRYSYGHTGHLHHRKLIENNLMVTEQHRTLSAPNAYGAGLGHTSGRDAQVITYSKRFGDVGRVVVSADQVEAA